MSPVFALSKLVVKEIFRKKDFYVSLILVLVILFYASQLQFYKVENIVRYLMEIGLSLVFFFSVILTAALAARQYPSEVQNRTCAVLLAKPVSRFGFILGKFLGSFFGGALCFFIFYALFVGMVWNKAGSLSFGTAAQVFYLFLLNLLVLSAMASGFSYFLTVPANVTLTIVNYLLINTYGSGLKEAGRDLFGLNRVLAETLYYLLPHFEFFDMRQRFIHGWGPISWDLLGILTAYALVYTALFLFLGWLKFRRQYL